MKLPRKKKRKSSNEGSLEGQLLIAMPLMSDRRFARSVIYMCAHSQSGAMGLIINQRAENISATALLERLGIDTGVGDSEIRDVSSLPIQVGGPVEMGRGFVLHSADYSTDETTLPIEGGICLTATLDILKAIAEGRGPSRAILALGYSGWSPGQLESEIQANGWLHCPADPDIIFGDDLENKYHRALAKLGVDLTHLVNASGKA